jgi:endoglucanase
VINAIRLKDPDNLIVVGTREWSQQVVEAANDPIKDGSGNKMPNVAYSLHYYASDNDHQKLMARADSAMDKGIALFATEWGNSLSSGGGSLDMGRVNTFMNWNLSKKLSWCNWSLSDIPEVSAALKNGTWNGQGLISHVISTDGDWSDSDLSESGKFVRNTILANRPAYTPPGSSKVLLPKDQMNKGIQWNRMENGYRIHLPQGNNYSSVELVNSNGRIVSRVAIQSGLTEVWVPMLGNGPNEMFVRVK